MPIKLLRLVKEGKYPQSSIIVSNDIVKANQVASMLSDAINKKASFQMEGAKVDDIRKIIADSQALSSPFAFVLYRADNMNQQAQNALLKIFEEPPKNAFFILVTDNLGGLLPTVQSRAKTFVFSAGEEATDDEYKELQKLAEKVIMNLEKVNPANLLKVQQSVKEEHLELFLRCLSEVIIQEARQFGIKTSSMLMRISRARMLLYARGVNKLHNIDMMLLDLKREVMRNANK